MTIVRAWLRLELPRRRRSLAVLALLVALASGTVLAAVAGARREASVVERLTARTKPSTVSVYSNTPNFDWAKVRAMPGVEALTTFLLDYAYAYEGLPDGVGGFPPADSETLHSIETYVVYEGRVFDPARADEVVVTRQFVKEQHKGVGDTVMLDLPTPAELAAGSGSGPDGQFTGPHLRMHIVGVVTSSFFSDEPGAPGFVQMSPGVVARYPANTLGPTDDPRNLFNFVSAVVRLRGGEAAIPAFSAQLKASFPEASLEITDNVEQFRQAQRHIRFLARCLLAFAGAAFVASLFLIGQSVARYATASSSELGVLRATGMTPGQVAAASSAAVTLAGVVGAAGGVAAAYGASALFPLGIVDLLEPAPGWSADWVVFSIGSATVIALITGAALAAAWITGATARRDGRARRPAVAAWTARAGLSVPVVVGTRFALEAGRGRTSVPVRPALIGAITGVLGVLAAFTFARGVGDSLDHRERFGQTVALQSYLGAEGQDYLPADKIVATVAANPDVAGINDTRQAIATHPGSAGTIVLYTHAAGTRSTPVALLDGRLPSAPDEVALAPTSLALVHADVGDRVELTGDRSARTFLITGKTLMPQGPRNGYADGGFVLPAAYDAMFSSFKFHMLQVSLRPGADAGTVSRDLASAITASVPSATGSALLRPPDTPVEIYEIEQVRWLPVVLGIFLAVLAIAAVGHALATAVRRRARDVAVLRALGMTQRQCRSIVATQATLLAAVGLVVGIPLGLALGRTVWRAVAHSTPIVYSPPLAGLVLALLAPAALVVANLLATLPARRAARLRIAQILRAE
jgi:hypothetical protein